MQPGWWGTGHARVGRGLPLLATNALQMAASGVFCGLVMLAFETPRIVWSEAAFLALGYLTVVVSLGGGGWILIERELAEQKRIAQLEQDLGRALTRAERLAAELEEGFEADVQGDLAELEELKFFSVPAKSV